MKMSSQMSARIRDMLTKDKLGLNDGFLAAFKGDITHLVKDYFDIEGQICVDVVETEDGKYKLSILATAGKINAFETTMQKRL